MEHESLLADPRIWVAIAFALFVALAYKKVAALLASTLDERSIKIKSELDQARALREEAEHVLAEYKKKQAESLKEAEAILAKTRQDADAFARQAEKDLKASMEERTKQAVEKIARAEEQAIQEVREHVVDLALAAARMLILEQSGPASQDELIKLALADIEQKIH